MTRDTALIYVRVSRLEAEERGRKVSPDMQREKALALPELRNITSHVFEDLDISGKGTANRPSYLALMARLAHGDVRYVVAYDLSRITRHVSDQQAFFDALQQHGAQFLAASSGRTVDAANEDDEYVATIEGAGNQRERKKTARRVRDTLATKVARGELVGPVPAGYLRRKEVLPSGRIARTWVEPDPERAPTIQLIFREYASGSYSFKSLARELNRRGTPLVRPPHFNNGRPPAEFWTADTVKDLIGNPRYASRIPRRDGRTFAGIFPALVDDATWTACERIRIQGRHIRLAKGARRSSPYLLSGVLRCARCGSTVSGESRKADSTHPNPRYLYTCYRRRVAKACDLPFLRQDVLEAELVTVLRSIALPEGLAEAVDAAVGAYMGTEGRASRRDTLRTLDDRQKRLNDLYEMGRVTREEYTARSADLDERRKSLQAERPRPLFVRQRTMLRSLVDDWRELTIGERKKLLGHIFAEIRADADGVATLVPQDDWKPYVRAVVPLDVAPGEHSRGGYERKTGLGVAMSTRRVLFEAGRLRVKAA